MLRQMYLRLCCTPQRFHFALVIFIFFFIIFFPQYNNISGLRSLSWSQTITRFIGKQAGSELWHFELSQKVAKKLQAARAYADSERVNLSEEAYCRGEFVTVKIPGGRLGNLLFTTASLLGIAKRTKRLPLFMTKDPRHAAFAGFWIPSAEDFKSCSWTVEDLGNITWEKGPAIYTTLFEYHILKPGLPHKPLFIGEFLQSFRYFNDIQSSVRLLFTFNETIYDKALEIAGDIFAKYFASHGAGETPELIGVHVRRGDFVYNPLSNVTGFLPATDAYLTQAVDVFRGDNKAMIFLVASDDLNYTKALFNVNGTNDVFVLPPSSPEVHMAVMSLTNQFVVTVGTFSWWCAYLIDAEYVFYYPSWLNGSELEPDFPTEDYFPPEWIGVWKWH